MALFEYTVEAQSGHARAGSFETAHGTVKTPLFMPVGTSATVKGIRPQTLKEIGSQIVLSNTYHLAMRLAPIWLPRRVASISFIAYDGPMLTDSGGFQIFSLEDTRKLDDDGVTFTSIYDGDKIRWTPEDNMDIQQKLGADIIMQLDQCPLFIPLRANLSSVRLICLQTGLAVVLPPIRAKTKLSSPSAKAECIWICVLSPLLA